MVSLLLFPYCWFIWLTMFWWDLSILRCEAIPSGWLYYCQRFYGFNTRTRSSVYASSPFYLWLHEEGLWLKLPVTPGLQCILYHIVFSVLSIGMEGGGFALLWHTLLASIWLESDQFAMVPYLLFIYIPECGYFGRKTRNLLEISV